MAHPCLSCGACCAHFRVSFYWGETDPSLATNPVPAELTEKISPFLSCMKGTNEPDSPRCLALSGEVGRRVACTIYENRSSSCRNFEASFENGSENPRCADARNKKGLPPLTAQDWEPLRN
jgi:Fe-S-cluster containining protein